MQVDLDGAYPSRIEKADELGKRYRLLIGQEMNVWCLYITVTEHVSARYHSKT